MFHCRSLPLSALSLCQLLLFLPRSFIGSVFVLLHLTKMSHRKILGYYCYYYIYSMEQSPLAEANRFSACQEIPQFLWNPEAITSFTSASHLSLSRARSIQSITTSHFLKIHHNILIPSMSRSPKWSLSFRFPQHIPVYPCIPLTSWAIQTYYLFYYYYVSIIILFAISYSIIMHPVKMQWNLKVSLKVFQCTYCVEERLLEWWPSLWLQVCHRQLQDTATAVQ